VPMSGVRIEQEKSEANKELKRTGEFFRQDLSFFG